MNKKVLLMTVGLALVGCTFLTGPKTGTKDPKTGEKKEEYGESPFVDLSTLIGGLFGVGALTGAGARLIRNAARARDGIMDANEKAIDGADWTKINTAESFKLLLKTAQESHDDSVLIKKQYDSWNTKRKLKAIKKS